MNRNSQKYNQARRILQTYLFISGSGKVSVNEVMKHIFPDASENDHKTTRRYVQRLLDILVEEEYVEKILQSKHEGNLYQVIEKRESSSNIGQIRGDETLAFYFAKALIEQFKGTSLANAFEKLSETIESVAPDEYIPEQDILNFQMPGMFDLSLKPEMLMLLLKKINERTWLRIAYQKRAEDDTKVTEVMPQSLTLYSGVLYLIAYNPRAKKNLTYSISNILNITDADNQNRNAPQFDSDIYRRDRFAVIDGSPVDVKIFIKPEFAKYFENRNWHISQKISKNKDSLQLEFEVPIISDLTAWLLGWSDAIMDIEPKELKDIFLNKLRKAIHSIS